MRFSLRWIFWLVAFAGVSCLSLKYPSPALSKSLYAALLAFLSVALLGAIYSGRRPFWLGCAIIGWLYLASSYQPGKAATPWHVANDILRDTANQIHQSRPQINDFMVAGHSLIAFTLAMTGGIVAANFDAQSRRHTEKLSPQHKNP